MSKKTFPLKVIGVSGTAGHGKDTAMNIIIEHYTGSEFIPIRMAAELKKMAATLLEDGKAEELGFDNKVDAMEHLKDTAPDYKVVGNLNARQLQQQMGTEVLRSFDENIHILFECAKIAQNENDNAVFYSSDIRFVNEANFLFNLGQQDTKELAKSLVHERELNLTTDQVIDRMSEVFGVNIAEHKNVRELRNAVEESFGLLKQTPKPEVQLSMKPIDSFDIPNLTKEAAFEFGYIRVFRPILSEDFLKEQEGKNPPAAVIRQAIRDYTQLPSDQVYNIQASYENSGVPFTVDNIKDRGFGRPGIDFNHESETALRDYRPEAMESLPMHLYDLKDAILKLTQNSNRSIQKTLGKIDRKKNPTQARGFSNNPSQS